MTMIDSRALTAIVSAVDTAPDTAVSIASVSFVNRFKRRPEERGERRERVGQGLLLKARHGLVSLNSGDKHTRRGVLVDSDHRKKPLKASPVGWLSKKAIGNLTTLARSLMLSNLDIPGNWGSGQINWLNPGG